MGSDPDIQSTGADTGTKSNQDPGEGTNLRAGEIIGLRAWRVGDGYKLFSIYFDVEWPQGCPLESAVPDPMVTFMQNAGIHAFKFKPALDEFLADCVLYSTCDPKDEKIIGRAWGAVELWGAVWEHQNGYRAQYARPLQFFDAMFGIDLKLLNQRYARAG